MVLQRIYVWHNSVNMKRILLMSQYLLYFNVPKIYHNDKIYAKNAIKRVIYRVGGLMFRFKIQ